MFVAVEHKDFVPRKTVVESVLQLQLPEVIGLGVVAFHLPLAVVVVPPLVAWIQKEFLLILAD